MAAIGQEALDDFFERYTTHPATSALADRWRQAQSEPTKQGINQVLLELYESAAAVVEEELWTSGCPDEALEFYQRLFREMESHIASNGTDLRFEFIVIIPVADRPQHLASCLGSLLKLCQRFGYGGIANGRYNKINVLIADDSKEPLNIKRNRRILAQFNQQGLKTLYFGQAEQLQQLDRLTSARKEELTRIIGNHARTAFYHKGASITRNISYLKLHELAGNNGHCLYWFMDSDQEFQINTGNGNRNVFAINYFHRLNQIFSTSNTLVLTGKVVGDPPVSPAVMAGNFLDDVIGFLSDISNMDPRQACQFHDHVTQSGDDASYHDMADLFGFEPTSAASQYHCRVDGAHDHIRCFTDFSEKLNRFFDGEHPTRQTHYEHQDLRSSVKPARTVYTGNYVFRTEALQHFIPFATLKLRMAGPVLGRILKPQLDERFVSANLPLLHKRTVDEIGQSEFRPGIAREDHWVDLSGEFERQFYGDVMLFTIESLTTQGYPLASMPEKLIRQTLTSIEAGMQQKYTDKHAQILEKLNRLKSLFGNPQSWWNHAPESQLARANFQPFIHNMEHNFGEASAGYRMINSDTHRRKRHSEILEAILRLAQDRLSWQKTLRHANTPE